MMRFLSAALLLVGASALRPALALLAAPPASTRARAIVLAETTRSGDTAPPIGDTEADRGIRGRPWDWALSNRRMEMIAAKCGISSSQEDPEDDRELGAFFYPRFSNHDFPDEGECFSDWSGLETDPAAGGYIDPRYGVANDGFDDAGRYIFWGTNEDVLYDGHRDFLESMLRQGWDRMGPSFRQIPSTARWTIQPVAHRGHGNLMPVLRDDEQVYLLCPTSFECLGRTGELTMPTPAEERNRTSGHGTYTVHDVWFEDCGDGGAYVLALDDTVVLFYVDGPGDMIMGRWQCTKHQWESMWLSAFGTTTVDCEDPQRI